MTSTALARKWRPRTFAQLIGQEHVNKALIHSLTHGRLHHAYLFTGTRGVGKTTIARLLAKALNCEQALGAEPCLTCDTCLSIEQGRYIDLIEIDGASKTRVEDTRELLDNVPYAPTLGRYKIYLIDEVHMLSQHSFNALLKTLEEPPEHVIFLLATTEPQKLPLTVLSRCLHFHLKPLSIDMMCAQMGFILTEESIPFEQDALPLLAKAAKGSMRDALSLLDQAIASGHGQLRTLDVQNSLGLSHVDYALQLLQALTTQAVPTLLAISGQMNSEGVNYQHVIEDLLSDLHQISVLQALGPHASPLIAIPTALMELSLLFSPEETQLLYQIALKGSQDLLIAPTPLIGFEMTLLRMHTFMPAPKTDWMPSSQPSIEPLTTQEPEQRSPTTTINETRVSLDQERPWNEIIAALNLTGLALAAAENAEFMAHKDGCVILRTAHAHRSLFTPSTLKKLEERLSAYYNKTTRLTLQSDETSIASPAQHKIEMNLTQREEAQAALHADPFFHTLQQTFSAELIENSIAPSKDDL